MEKEYKIKGIEKIVSKISTESLAKYYEVSIDSDFESIMIDDFKKNNIPSGLDVALYFSPSSNSQDEAKKVYEENEEKKALIGFTFMSNVLYFFVDEPIDIKNFGSIVYQPKYFIGGVQYNSIYMGKDYYEKHKNELENSFPDKSKLNAVEKYVENFIHEFKDVAILGGYGPKPKYEEAEEIKEEKNKNEKIILELTGKNSIDELSLKDFIVLKKQLEKEEERLKKQFVEKFTKGRE